MSGIHPPRVRYRVPDSDFRDAARRARRHGQRVAVRYQVPTRGGFTLIELMAVLVILSILIAVLVTQLGSADDVAKSKITKGLLDEIGAVIGSYDDAHGDFPPSSFTPEQGQPPNPTNIGAECLVIALFSKGFAPTGGNLDEQLCNTDGDQSKVKLTDFGSLELFEFRDSWGNPIAYFHRADYGRAQLYVTIDANTGESVETELRAVRNQKLGRYYAHDKYQLRSAGPDGRFGTDDDVHSFDVERK